MSAQLLTVFCLALSAAATTLRVQDQFANGVTTNMLPSSSSTVLGTNMLPSASSTILMPGASMNALPLASSADQFVNRVTTNMLPSSSSTVLATNMLPSASSTILMPGASMNALPLASSAQYSKNLAYQRALGQGKAYEQGGARFNQRSFGVRSALSPGRSALWGGVSSMRTLPRVYRGSRIGSRFNQFPRMYNRRYGRSSILG